MLNFFDSVSCETIIAENEAYEQVLAMVRLLWYPAVSAAGQKLKQGTLLGTLKDSYGNEIACYTAPFDGVVLYYTLSLGVKSGDPLIAYGKL